MIQLEPDEFNDLIEDLGQDVAWRRSHECPCRDPQSGAQDPDCRVCTNGRIWDAPVCSVLGVTGQQIQRQWAQFGQWENGDVVVTLPSNTPAYQAGEYDRVVFSQSSVAFSDHRTNDGTPQRLPYVIDAITRVFWLNDDKTATVEGRIPVVRDNGELRWTSGGPPEGVQYTVTGRRHPEYFVWGPFPQDRAHHHGRPLPRKVVLRSFDLFRRGA